MALFAIPAIGLLTLGIIETSFSTKTEDDCGQSISTLFLNGWLTNPYLFYFVALISILFSFYVLRIYKSKPE
jgi:predicted membrane protein